MCPSPLKEGLILQIGQPTLSLKDSAITKNLRAHEKEEVERVEAEGVYIVPWCYRSLTSARQRSGQRFEAGIFCQHTAEIEPHNWPMENDDIIRIRDFAELSSERQRQVH